MKKFALICAFLISSSAFARQYIQCSVMDVDSSDVMVVNLQTTEGGTLFLSPGVQYDEHILVKIAFDKIENKHHIYKVVDENGTGYVSVPSDVIGKSSNSFEVDLAFESYSFTYACFSRIYEE